MNSKIAYVLQHFKSNPHLTSKIITKKFTLDEEEGKLSGEVTAAVQWNKNFASKNPNSFLLSWSKNCTEENVEDQFDICKMLADVYESPFSAHDVIAAMLCVFIRL